MPLSQYLILIASGTVFSWGAWLGVIGLMNPFAAGGLGFMLFYGSLTFALTGTFALLGFGIRSLLIKQELELHAVTISFRQALFFSLLIDGVLLLQSRRLLAWYTIVFLIFSLAIAELFVVSRKPLHHR